MARHDQPKMPKWALVDDINEWIRRVTKDDGHGLRDAGRITMRDLEMIAYAIQCSEPVKRP